jgi:hypothetical protein
LDTFTGRAFFIELLLSTLLILLSRRRPTVFEGLTFLAFAGLALKTTRGIIWFGLMTAPLLAASLRTLAQRLPIGTESPPSLQQQRLNALLAVLLLAGSLISLPWFKALLPLPAAKSGVISQETPIAATDFLLQQPQSGPRVPRHVLRQLPDLGRPTRVSGLRGFKDRALPIISLA